MNRLRVRNSLCLFAVLVAFDAAVVLPACSGEFTGCSSTRTCPEAGGEAGAPDGASAGVSEGAAAGAGESAGEGGGGATGSSEGGAGGEAGTIDAAGAAGMASTPTCQQGSPCSSGQGPCTTDADCAASLVCGAGAGAKFGFSGNACVPKHCTNDLTDGGETSQDCGAGCGCATFEVLSAPTIPIKTVRSLWATKPK
jgi:hypothetical protein